MQEKRRIEPVARGVGAPTREAEEPKNGAAFTQSTRVAPAADFARSRFDIVALVASAGGLEALSAVLRGLPEDFPAAVIIAQHLGGQGSALVNILRTRATLPIGWASPGSSVTAGHVLVCPPRRQVEVLPDGTLAIGGEIGARDKPLDALLESVADSYGPRALAVVLTGMGKDGAVGAASVKRAGGVVLVQSEETAEQPSMPRAAVACGASDLVLPLYEISGVVADVVAGGELPRPRAEMEAAEALFSGAGDVRRLLRGIDWSRTALGPLAAWPDSLRGMLRLVLDSPMPMLLLWGPDLICLYNDPYRLLMGVEHRAGLGQSNRALAPDLWHLTDAIYTRVLSGEAAALSDALCRVTRRGTPEDAWFDLSFTPIRGEGGTVAGVLATIVETTTRVLSQRRLRTLQTLTVATAGVTNVHAAMQRALGTLRHDGGADTIDNDQDVPFALCYLRDTGNERAQLVASSGVSAGEAMAPHTIDVRAGHPAWPLGSILGQQADRSSLLLDDLSARFRGALVGPNEEAPASALLLPLRPIADQPPVGVLICGINPRLVLDDVYRAFLELVAARVSASLAEAQVRQAEHERIDRMAELDRAKTEFFSNVSHEFRTPLTLLLAPLEELSRREDQFPESVSEEIRVASRNARRLLNQVNTLLDFSQAEASRLRANFTPTDLPALTRDIASVFRSAAERAGLRLRVECPPMADPVWVDPQMWEKIVGNLLSNALKFTLEDEIVVELGARAMHAELVVRDTGIGIPEEDRLHVFKRFHRVPGRRGRTIDGSGIGLALVHELVRLHQGRVRVNSVEGEGTTFTVWVPMGRRPAREPAPHSARVSQPDPQTWAPGVATVLAEEAEHWSPNDNAAGIAERELGAPNAAAMHPSPTATKPGEGTVRRARVLVVDDNADMREYFRRLLKDHWDVEVAADGSLALADIQRATPDLVITDVMMPGLDGFELLKRIRGDEKLKYTPVVLVTARAGEEAAIEGLRAGAADYIAKPFSSRELHARVQAVIERSRADAALRQRREEALRDLEDARRLQSISSLLIEPGSGEALHEQILDAAIAITRSDFGSAQLIDEASGELELIAWRNFHPASAEYWNRVSVETGSICGMAMGSGQRVMVPNVDEASVRMLFGAGTLKQFELCGIRAVQSTPLITRDGRVVGVISTHWRRVHTPDQRELLLLDILARQAADLFERQHTVEALQAGEERLRRLAGVPGVGILTFDAATGTLLDANESFFEMTGYSRQQVELRELTWRTMTPPEYIERSERELARLADTGRLGPYEKEYFRADGSRSRMVFAGADLGDGKVVEYCVDLGDRGGA